MLITKEHKILVKNLFSLEGYNAEQLVREFSSKGWNVDSVYKLLQKLMITGSVNHHPTSGRRHTTHTANNIDLVYELVLQKLLCDK